MGKLEKLVDEQIEKHKLMARVYRSDISAMRRYRHEFESNEEFEEAIAYKEKIIIEEEAEALAWEKERLRINEY